MKTCAYTKLDGERCTNPVEGKMHFCCGAHKQAAYRLRQFAVQRFEKETTAHLKTQLSNAIREYNDITCDETLQSWREEGWLTARERQEALEHYREAYDDLK